MKEPLNLNLTPRDDDMKQINIRVIYCKVKLEEYV